MNENEQKKVNAEERREEIRQFIKEEGFHKINRSELARKYKVSHVTICNDLQIIMKSVNDDTIDSIISQLSIMFNEAISICRVSLRSNNEAIRLKAVGALTGAISEFTRFLEAYGHKDKIPDKIEMANVSFEQLRGLLRSDPELERLARNEFGIQFIIADTPEKTQTEEKPKKEQVNEEELEDELEQVN